jgi:polysaccharide deacetylase
MDNIFIFCPEDNREERKYILTTLFQDLLGVPVQISFVERANYEFIIGDKKVIFVDAFFSKFKESLSYLNMKNVPDSLVIENTLGVDVPLVWGTNECIVDDKEIYIGNDVLATAFFFLTQWEEYVLKASQGLSLREKIDEKLLFVVRNKLQKRCLVNDILEFLKVLLKRCGIDRFKMYHFDVMLTHDVDRCFLSSYEELCDNINQMLEMGDNERARRILRDYISYRKQKIDPFDSFDELMDISDQYGFKNHFYFKPCIIGDEGFTYSLSDDFVVRVIKNILTRGHYIGLHATENTPHSYKALKMENERLKGISGCAINGGRTHSLIYSPDVFRNLDRLGLLYDSGVGFQYHNGFRSSVCYPYPIFCIPERKKLNIKQYPFMVMDSVSVRNKVGAEDFLKDIVLVIDTVKKYEGLLVTNWHSNMFNAKGREEFKEVYRMMVEYSSKIMG